jgi:hypothetical protein
MELCRTTSVATGPRNFIANKGRQRSRLGEVFVCAARAILLRCITKPSAPASAASVHVSSIDASLDGDHIKNYPTLMRSAVVTCIR